MSEMLSPRQRKAPSSFFDFILLRSVLDLFGAVGPSKPSRGQMRAFFLPILRPGDQASPAIESFLLESKLSFFGFSTPRRVLIMRRARFSASCRNRVGFLFRQNPLTIRSSLSHFIAVFRKLQSFWHIEWPNAARSPCPRPALPPLMPLASSTWQFPTTCPFPSL